MKLFLLSAVPALALRGYNEFGCSTTDPTAPCIQPLTLSNPQQLAPASIMTDTDSSGFIRAEVQPGDDGSSGDPGAVAENSKDPATPFFIKAQPMGDDEPPPRLIYCALPEACTTSTTVAPVGV